MKVPLFKSVSLKDLKKQKNVEYSMGGGGLEFKIWCHDNQPNVTQQNDT
jgi:hypothetical protein